MESKDIILKLEKNGLVFESLFKNITEEQISWKANENKWSMLEIVCHLLDEEKEDFRQRIDFTLNNPGEAWPAIDPQGWVRSRNYSGKNFDETLNQFLAERKKSIEWLYNLSNPNWQVCYLHPKAGEVSAEQLLANWIAHDLLHIRQITATNYAYLLYKTSPIKLDYAGKW
ncbi:MAG: DinB family protein [Calditrichaeota bacterium]|nr:MAG: DinB family protein [Calditrichota bacterium]MBL1204808.1 DinB family protein [Calditrichota bacterium]NOG44637.1 DinB family protein [Calditrichota bacterium]